MERGARCSVSSHRQVRVSLCLWEDEDLGILDLSPGICAGVGLGGVEEAVCKFQETLPERRWGTRGLWEG